MADSLPKVLVIDDDRAVHLLVERALAGIASIVVSASASEGLQLVDSDKPDVILLDINLPDTNGLAVFCEIHEKDRRIPVIFITAGAGSDTAIEAMQLGGYDYVAKPLEVGKLRRLAERAIESRQRMSVPVAVAAADIDSIDTQSEQFLGSSPGMLEVFKAIGRVAQQNVTVLIRGESGTGKELVARALYQHSQRHDQTFLAVNCAALPDNLLESELFGHEKGSFTGADRRRIGKFEQCNGGTLFLDEIGDMSPSVQAKVLRVLQEQRFERIGGNKMIQTDVRIIAATNQPLEQMVETGEFRDDLLYRLNGVTIQLPPLRERGDDVMTLLQYFLNRAKLELNKIHIEGIAPSAAEMLRKYTWPGNVRQLQAVVRRAVLNASGPVIVPEFLPSEVRDLHAEQPEEPEVDETTVDEPEAEPRSELELSSLIEQRLAEGSNELYAEVLEVMERYLLTRVLQETGGNQSQAAEILGITRGKIRDRIASFGIEVGKTVTAARSGS